MCLMSVDAVKPKSSGFGWKVFKKEGKKVRASTVGVQVYDYNTWYQASSGTLITQVERTRYPMGFHIALTRQDARDFINGYHGDKDEVVRKVEYRGAYVTGDGAPFFPGKQVIAAEIRILPETRPKRVKNAQKTVTGIPGTQTKVARS